MEKVKSLLEREQKEEGLLITLVKNFNALGEKYFSKTRSGYVGCDEINEEGITEFTTYTKEEFLRLSSSMWTTLRCLLLNASLGADRINKRNKTRLLYFESKNKIKLRT